MYLLFFHRRSKACYHHSKVVSSWSLKIDSWCIRASLSCWTIKQKRVLNFMLSSSLIFYYSPTLPKPPRKRWVHGTGSSIIYIYKTCSFFSLIFYVYIIQSNQLIRYKVYGHPLFLDSIELHDIAYNSTHKHVITIVEKTALQQKIQVYSLQAASKDDKVCIPKITIDMY